MNTYSSVPRVAMALLISLALTGCGGATQTTATPVTLTPPECASYQEVRGDACVYIVAAEQGCLDADAAACTVAGHAYMSGEEVAVDQAHAAELYARACQLDDPEGCASLAASHFEGRGVDRDLSEAARLFSLACELGDSSACFMFGACLAGAFGVEQDQSRAMIFFERGCAGGEAEGCVALGSAYIQGTGVERNVAHGAELFARACDANHIVACIELGLLVERHPDVPRDGARAMTLYERACELNEPVGCFHVGRALGEGVIVPLDAERARGVLSGLCQQDIEAACDLHQGLSAPAPTAEQTAASCASPARLALGREVTGSTVDASPGLTATCGLLASSPERVFTLVIARPTRVKVDLFASFDGVVHIRSACSSAPESQVACNDDAPGDDPTADERHSALEVELQRGTYFVVVDGYGLGESGTFRLKVDRAP